MQAGARRVFIGLQPPAELARALREHAALALARCGLNVVEAGELHVTLAFLGAIDARALERVPRALESAVAETAPIESVVEGFGAFPRASDARVIWAGVRERPEPASGLHALYLRVHGALDGLGLALEPAQARSTWQAHVTLARRQRAQRARLDAREPIAELERAWRAVDWRVDSLCLFESDRARARGSRYPVLARIPLNG